MTDHRQAQREDVQRSRRIASLDRRLYARLPWIGGWLRRLAAASLVESLEAGNPQAAEALAQAACLHPDPLIKKTCVDALARIKNLACLDAAWSVWLERRSAILAEILAKSGKAASHPADARVYSALFLGQTDFLTGGPAENVEPLIHACDDPDLVIAGQARDCLERLKSQPVVDAFCAYWCEHRTGSLGEVLHRRRYIARKPPEVRVLSALKAGELGPIQKGSASVVIPLVGALQDREPEIASRARECLLHLEAEAAIDQFCACWVDNRTGPLTGILVETGYVAQQPLDVRIWTALKTGSLAYIEYVEAAGIEPLLSACRDPDAQISQKAQSVLSRLKHPDAQEALCQVVIDREEELARKIAIQSGYEPRAIERRALFYFLAGDLERYQVLDFDGRLLRAVYEASPETLRLRIARAIQKSGRTDLVTVIAGGDSRSRIATLSADETEVLYRMLISSREWETLWRLALDLPYYWSVKIARILAKEHWRPGEAADRETFLELSRLASDPAVGLVSGWESQLPPAVQRSQVRVHGRINDAAFSPDQRTLAITTGIGKVVLWDFEKGEIQRVLSGFNHSINPVGFTAGGTLVFGERSRPGVECRVYTWKDDRLSVLGKHSGQVTAIEPFLNEKVLSCGRDQRVTIWDLTGGRLAAEKAFHFWPRAARVAPNGQQVALLHDGITLAGLPDLDIRPGAAERFRYRKSGQRSPGMARCAAFAPSDAGLLVGQYNGQVVFFENRRGRLAAGKAALVQHPGEVRGIEFLSSHPVMVSACSQGWVKFLDWPGCRPLGSVHALGERLTSMCISPGSAFMALGDSDASLSFWDLRVLDIPMIFTRPLVQATPDHLAAIKSLADRPGLQPAVLAPLQYLRCALEHRFRYDIQVAVAPVIRPGEFDILIDG